MIELNNPIEKLLTLSDFTQYELIRWLWMNNQELGGTMPVYFFGTEREQKAIVIFKKFALKNNKLKNLGFENE